MRTWAIGFLAVALALAGCGTQDAAKGGAPAGASGGALTKLEIKDTKPGTGPGAMNGDVLLVEYTGKLADGTAFDSTADRDNAPFSIVLGSGKVIKGWDQGLVGMKEGGTRKLSIPPSLGYGEQAAPGGKIPANSDLFFEIKLDKLIPAADADTPVIDHLKRGTGPKSKKGDTVTIKYKGYFVNGTVFDPGAAPFSVKLGATPAGAITGMEAGVTGRQVGDTFRLTIPPEWGYGPQGNRSIPGNAWLVFDIQVTDIKH
jgi:peptidylprolyl isomerase